MAARLAAEDAVLVLQGQHVERAHVQEVGRAAVRGKIALGDLESNSSPYAWRRPASFMATTTQSTPGTSRDRIGEVARERGDAALPREVVSQQGYAADRSGVLVLAHALSPRARITEQTCWLATPDEPQS